MRLLDLKVLVVATMAFASPLWASEITIALGAEPSTLDPHTDGAFPEKQVNNNIFESVINRDPDGKLELGLAADWPKQIDATTWEIKLRPGITFTNGEPLDAAAVAFSVNRIVDPELNSPQQPFFTTFKSAEAVDETTVRIVTTGPDPILTTRLYYLMIAPPKATLEPGFKEHPVGTGPYKFVSWDRGNTIKLEINQDYWGTKPQVGAVTYRFIPEAGTRIAALMAGEVDLIDNLPAEFKGQVPQAFSKIGVEHSMVILNTDQGVTADQRVRQALNYAIDKEAIVKSIFDNEATVQQGQVLSPMDFGFNKDLAPYPYDPEKAKALIAEAGAEGQKITLVSTSGRWAKDRELSEIVGGYWSAVGLDVNVQILDFSEYLKRLFDRNTRADALFVVTGNELLDADRPLSTYYEPGGRAASNNFPEFKEWIPAARTETDLEKRAAIYNETVAFAREQATHVSLVDINNAWGASTRIVWTPRVDGKIIVSTITLN